MTASETTGTRRTASLRDSMISPRSVEESVTEALRSAILRGELEPGQRLAQVELSEELGVSRIPLRDALRRLEAEGLVEIDGRRGARVSSLTASDVSEIYEMRILLESECARRALASLTDGDVEELISLSEEMDRTAEDPHEGAVSRRNFYGVLYGKAELPRMRATVLQLRALVQRYHVLTDSGGHPHTHDELRQCIRERDAERGAAVIREHLEAARDDLVSSLTSGRAHTGGAG